MKFGLPTYTFDVLDSTNAYAAQLLDTQQDVAEGTVIDTRHQTNGQGQKDRIWYSNPGQNITLSLILKPAWLPIRRQFWLNVMTSMAIVRTVKHYAEDTEVKVKWPNDVYIKDNKVSGILIRLGLQGSTIQYAIVGIGLNVLQQQWPHCPSQPVSLSMCADQMLSIDEVKGVLLQHLHALYDEIRSDPERLVQTYIDLLYKKGIETDFMYDNRSFRGAIRSIDASGRLLVDTQDGLRTFEVGEISFDNSISE